MKSQWLSHDNTASEFLLWFFGTQADSQTRYVATLFHILFDHYHGPHCFSTFLFFLFKMINLWMFPFPPLDLFLENGLRSFTVKMTVTASTVTLIKDIFISFQKFTCDQGMEGR